MERIQEPVPNEAEAKNEQEGDRARPERQYAQEGAGAQQTGEEGGVPGNQMINAEHQESSGGINALGNAQLAGQIPQDDTGERQQPSAQPKVEFGFDLNLNSSSQDGNANDQAQFSPKLGAEAGESV